MKQNPTVIGISTNFFPAEDRILYKNKALYVSETNLCDAVAQAGALPVILPFVSEPAAIQALLDRVDGLLLSGGIDIDPSNYGDELLNERWRGQQQRDRFEMALYQRAAAQKVPTLGVCRGMQFINVAHGGTLWQDIPSLRPDSLVHRNQELYDGLTHELRVVPGTFLAEILGSEPTIVNSVHHQGIRTLGQGLKAIAYAPDGLIEAVMTEPTGDVVGVQWHPEWMQNSRCHQQLFEWFVARAASTKANR